MKRRLESILLLIGELRFLKCCLGYTILIQHQ